MIINKVNNALVCLVIKNNDTLINKQMHKLEKTTKENDINVNYVYTALIINNDISESDIDELSYLLEQYSEIDTIIFIYNKHQLLTNNKISKSFNHKKYNIITIT